MTIMVVGGGIAGLTLVNLLQDTDYRIILVEKSTILRAAGYVVGVWKNGTDVLNHLNLLDDFNKRSFIADYQKTLSSTNKLLRITNFERLNQKYGDAIRFIHRADLFEVLTKNIDFNKLEIRLGSELTMIDEKLHSVVATVNGTEKIEVDYIVGADGVYSGVRELLFPNNKSVQHHDAVFSTFTFSMNLNEEVRGNKEYLGNGKIFGIYPFGKDRYGVYASIAQANNPLDLGNLKALRHEFREFSGSVKVILENLDENTSIYADYIKEISLKRWFNGRCILIGDAAHAMLPTTGQGLSAAMEDAFELSSSFLDIEKGHSSEHVFSLFQKKRKSKLKSIIFSSKVNHYALMAKNSFLCRVRDILLTYLPSTERKLDRFFSKQFITK